jgi:hypothetical protein
MRCRARSIGPDPRHSGSITVSPPEYYFGMKVPRVGQAFSLTGLVCQAESLTYIVTGVIDRSPLPADTTEVVGLDVRDRGGCPACS